MRGLLLLLLELALKLRDHQVRVHVLFIGDFADQGGVEASEPSGFLLVRFLSAELCGQGLHEHFKVVVGGEQFGRVVLAFLQSIFLKILRRLTRLLLRLLYHGRHSNAEHRVLLDC